MYRLDHNQKLLQTADFAWAARAVSPVSIGAQIGRF
jgi:hypothetical protein